MTPEQKKRGEEIDKFLESPKKLLSIEEWLVYNPTREPFIFKFGKVAKQA